MNSAELNDTKSRLLKTAAQLIWERSFQATSVDELCARANAKKGSFYHFFPSKSDLAVAAIERAWQDTKVQIFDAVFGSETAGLSQISEFVAKACAVQTALFGDTGQVWGCPFGNLGQEMAKQDERVREAVERIFESICRFIETALAQAEQAGEIPVGDNSERAKKIFALLQGAHLLAKVSNDPTVIRQVMAAVPVLAAS